MDAGEAVDGGPGTDELVFPDPHIEEAADEEEPDAQPGPVAFNRVPPSRSQPATQSEPADSKPSKKDVVGSKPRAPISYTAWEMKHGKSDNAKDDQVREHRSSRHHESSRHDSPRHPDSSRSLEGSRQREPTRHRDHSNHHESPRRKEAVRRQESSPIARQLRPSRPQGGDRHALVVPKITPEDREMDRRSRPERALPSNQRYRSHSPLKRTASHRSHRSVSPARQVLSYNRHRSLEASNHAPRHVPRLWPELFPASQTARVEDPSMRPYSGRAPIHATEPTWDSHRYEQDPYDSYPQAAQVDYRHREADRYTDYREPLDRDYTGYRMPVYRDAGYVEAGYAVTQSRAAESRQPAYDYGLYRDYPVTRSGELAHESYVRPEHGWDSGRQPDAQRHYPYKDVHSITNDRWHEPRHEQDELRRLPRADRDIPSASASFTRQASHSEHQPVREDAHIPRDDGRHHAPRNARDLAPPPRSYSRGHLDQAPRFAEEYPTRPGRSRDPYWGGGAPPPPPPAARHASPRGRRPRRSEHASDKYRGREAARKTHREVEGASDRGRHRPDRAEPREPAGVDALKLTSRSFAIEAAAKDGAPRHGAEVVNSGDLPPPPFKTASLDRPRDLPKPSRASVLVCPKAEPETQVEKETAGDSSPELNVEQGFLQAPADPPATRGRAFQRGHTTQEAPAKLNLANDGDLYQHSSVSQAKNSGQRSDRRNTDRSSKDQSSAPKVSPLRRRSDAQPRHAPLISREDTIERRIESGHRSKESGGRHRNDGHQGTTEASARTVSSKDRADRSEGRGAAKKSRANEGPSAAANSKSKVANIDGKGSTRAEADEAKALPAAKYRTEAGRDSKAAERQPDTRTKHGSPNKESKGSRREVVVAKQSGQKRRSRSPARSRSPKRKAPSPAKHSSGKTAGGRKQVAEGDAAGQALPPPPARPGSAFSEDKLPPPPVRPDSRQESVEGTGDDASAGELPNGTVLPLPPPPPKLSTMDKPNSAGQDATGPDTSEVQKPKSVEQLSEAAGKSEVSRRDGREQGKGSTVPAGKEGHRASEKPSSGRSGQKQPRSRSPHVANGNSAKPDQSSDARDALASSAKRVSSEAEKNDAKAGSVRNGQTGEGSKVSDKDAKEWFYRDKTKQYGPCTLKRVREMKQQLEKDKDPNKVVDFVRLTIWRNGYKSNKKQIRDVL